MFTTTYTLEYKSIDSKDRERAPKFVDVFSSLEAVEKKKKEMLAEIGSNITFQIYKSQNFRFN